MRPAASLLAWFIFTLWGATLEATPVAVNLTGEFARSAQRDPALGPTARLWDSRKGGDAGEGTLREGPFCAPDTLELAVSGFPGYPGLTLQLVRDDGARLDLRVRSQPADAWIRMRWNLPVDWRNRQVTLVAADKSTAETGGWLGVSEPLRPSLQFAPALRLAALQFLVFALLLFPGFGLALLVRSRDALEHGCWILVFSGLAAYVDFFAVFLRPAVAPFLMWIVLAIGVAACVARRRRLVQLIRNADFVIPLILGGLVCVFYAEGSFLYGGLESPLGVPMNRVLAGLPSDPVLPHLLASIIANGRPLHPFMLDWLSSDRPPLQAALEVLFWPWMRSDLGAALVGMAAQSWVWIGFWIFLRRLPLNAWQRSLVLFACVFSGFFFLNTIFYWPKLLPAAYLLAATGLLWRHTPDGKLAVLDAALAATCLALSMLGHGGSAFGITGMAVVYLIQRGLPGWRPFLAGTLVAAAVLTPWTLYQKFADPPGDRLIKFHLAGHPAIDPRPSLTVIREAYARTPWPEILENKLVNVQTLFFRQAGWWDNTRQSYTLLKAGRVRDAFGVFSRTSRIAGFFHYGQTLACLLPAVFGSLWLLVRRRGSDLEQAVRLAAGLTLASCVVWCLMMFSGGTTVIHQGSYFTGACLFTTVALGLAAFPRWLARLILGANLLWFFAIWMIAAIPSPEEAGRVADTGPFMGYGWLLTVFAVGLLAFLHWLSNPGSEPIPAPARSTVKPHSG